MDNDVLTLENVCSNIFPMSNYLSSLGYPFRERPMVFVFGVFMIWAMNLASWAPVVGWIANFCFLWPFMCAFFMKMVRQSAMGEEGMCHFPELEGWLEPFFMPYIRFLACVIFSFLPLGIYLQAVDWDPEGFLPWFLFAVGAVYFPGAFMRTALLESFSGLSPAGWWELVRRAPLAYLGVVAASFAGWVIITILPGGFLMDYVTAPAILYVVCVLMNIFGLFLLKHEFADDEDDDILSLSGPKTP